MLQLRTVRWTVFGLSCVVAVLSIIGYLVFQLAGYSIAMASAPMYEQYYSDHVSLVRWLIISMIASISTAIIIFPRRDLLQKD